MSNQSNQRRTARWGLHLALALAVGCQLTSAEKVPRVPSVGLGTGGTLGRDAASTDEPAPDQPSTHPDGRDAASTDEPAPDQPSTHPDGRDAASADEPAPDQPSTHPDGRDAASADEPAPDQPSTHPDGRDAASTDEPAPDQPSTHPDGRDAAAAGRETDDDGGAIDRDPYPFDTGQPADTEVRCDDQAFCAPGR